MENNKRVTFNKVVTGEFQVLLDGVATGHTIINGSKGLSGNDRNMYGIVRPEGTVRWIGTLQACKKALSFGLTRKGA